MHPEFKRINMYETITGKRYFLYHFGAGRDLVRVTSEHWHNSTLDDRTSGYVYSELVKSLSKTLPPGQRQQWSVIYNALSCALVESRVYGLFLQFKNGV